MAARAKWGALECLPTFKAQSATPERVRRRVMGRGRSGGQSDAVWGLQDRASLPDLGALSNGEEREPAGLTAGSARPVSRLPCRCQAGSWKKFISFMATPRSPFSLTLPSAKAPMAFSLPVMTSM